MLDRLEILYSNLRRTFSRNRWSSRLLGHPTPSRNADEPGLILVQVDGLGREALDQALRDGRMPFLKRLVEEDGYELCSLYTGLPSNTPAAQAELFYGVPAVVPAFRFRDPRAGRVATMNDRATAAELESHLRQDHKSLLENGSVWSGIFTGGAREAHFCVAGKGSSSPGLPVRGRLRLAGILAWHAWSAIRVLGNLAFISAIAFRDWYRGRIGRGELWRELHYVPFRVLVSAALREFITAGASIDAERGLPVIHLNFAGFDEHAHRRGPNARAARWVLKGIDRSVRRVWASASLSQTRDYQVWIYSDHGQERVLPFNRHVGESLPDTVTRVYDWVHRIVQDEGGVPPFLAFPATPGEARSQSLASGLPRWFMGPPPAEDATGSAHEAGGRTMDEGKALEVVYQGPLAFVHLPVRHARPVVAWLAEILAVEGKIPWVLVPDGEASALAFCESGTFHRLPEEAASVLGQEHPHLDAAARDLVRLAHHPGSGDLTLLGWNTTRPISFEIECGTHGGPGPRESTGFVIFPPETRAFTPVPATLRPADLREIALGILGRLDSGTPERPREAPAVNSSPETGEESPSVFSLRLMTYNVHGCRGMDGKFAPQRIARVIARERPDVICLQELDQERTRSGGVNQVAVIARRLRADYRFHAVANVDDGRFGNAVLSHYPLRLVTAASLPAAVRAKDMFHLEDRGAVWVALSVGGRTLHIINTHLSILQHERRLQAEALLGSRWLGHPECRGPVILTGDFNASPDSWTVRRLGTRLREAVGPERKERELRTWSGRVPLRRIDHVMVSEEVQVVGAYVPRTDLTRVASDHLPLVVDLVVRLTETTSREAIAYRSHD